MSPNIWVTCGQGVRNTLKAAGDDRLAGTRYDWLRNPASIEPKDRKEFSDLRNSELKTARAWALKETARALYERPEHPQEHAADSAEIGLSQTATLRFATSRCTASESRAVEHGSAYQTEGTRKASPLLEARSLFVLGSVGSAAQPGR